MKNMATSLNNRPKVGPTVFCPGKASMGTLTSVLEVRFCGLGIVLLLTSSLVVALHIYTLVILESDVFLVLLIILIITIPRPHKRPLSTRYNRRGSSILNRLFQSFYTRFCGQLLDLCQFRFQTRYWFLPTKHCT